MQNRKDLGEEQGTKFEVQLGTLGEEDYYQEEYYETSREQDVLRQEGVGSRQELKEIVSEKVLERVRQKEKEEGIDLEQDTDVFNKLIETLVEKAAFELTGRSKS